nr:hypothetical protein Iba_chr05dCG12180 [Ipomoea batatas]
MPSAPAVVKETTTQPATVVDVSPAVDFAQLNRAVTASPASSSPSLLRLSPPSLLPSTPANVSPRRRQRSCSSAVDRRGRRPRRRFCSTQPSTQSNQRDRMSNRRVLQLWSILKSQPFRPTHPRKQVWNWLVKPPQLTSQLKPKKAAAGDLSTLNISCSDSKAKGLPWKVLEGL